MLVTCSIFLDTRRIKKKAKAYPIKLRVYHELETEYYQTVIDLSKEDYDKLSSPRVNEGLQAIREQLKSLIRNAEAAIEELHPFSFSEFERRFVQHEKLFVPKYAKKQFQQSLTAQSNSDELPEEVKKRYSLFQEEHTRPGCISFIFVKLIEKLLKEERIGTASQYQTTYTSLKNFKGNVTFEEITVSYLVRYENWMLSKGRSKTTVGIYLRTLRTMFNEAIHENIVKRESYPFGRRKYRIPKGKNIKKALDIGDLQKIYYYNAPDDIESFKRAKDFWLFSYFGNGMNVKDIALLKYKNIQDGFLIFERSKTERANREDPKIITVYITEDMWAIIGRWGNKNTGPNIYIFPVVEEGANAQRQYDLIHLLTRSINEGMQHIAKKLHLEKKVTTYVARHTFSTTMKRSGASTEFIQEALGHTEKKTTENYLASFENSVKKEFAAHLNNFKKLPLNLEVDVIV